MRIAVDLHIHSALSPCGDSEMTPNNIVNMAYIKGLDVIAVTDHNSSENVGAVMKLGLEKGIIVIPGMEVQSREEVHLLCYFTGLDQTMDFQEVVYKNLDGINNPGFFGRQMIMDEHDRLVAENEKLLIGSTNLSVEQIINQVKERGGRVIPAHVDKRSYSIISNLGFIPPSLDIKTVEVSKAGDMEKLLREYGFLKRYHIVRSSDAHRLEDILEREFYIDAACMDVSGIVNSL
ncbi:MAG: hypothetical protein HPY66_0762 [Firmicutes bacterium]|nr:hypothetical protein [Bacillota bacterium]MDI6705688.1 PHP domain-containing protein [Bacillota bacterium]